MRRRLALGLTAALLTSVAAVPSGPAVAQGLDQTCVLALTAFDPATINVAFPDDSARYYAGAYAVAPGTRIRITGTFPHARYMSFNVYDPQLRPIDGLSDVKIVPDTGSANPFLPGADRTTTTRRDYTVYIDPGRKPSRPARNTLYTGAGEDGGPNLAGTFIYRIYIPDRGRDDYGGTGLPTARVEPAPAPATVRPPTSPCANVHKPTLSGINEAIAASSPPADVPRPTNGNPVWRKFVNLLSSLAINTTGSPAPGGVDLDKLGGSGGVLSNKDNAYVSTPISRTGGPIVVTRMRAPTFADTRPPSATMGAGQLRYWSVCSNDPPSQRFIACINDDRSVLTADGDVTIVTSTPAARPANAKPSCGVNWIAWGPNSGGLLIYRHMLPSAGFTQSIQAATVDKEAATMGAYLPVSTYYKDAAAYDKAVPCREGISAGTFQARAAATPSPGAATGSSAAVRRCASRRRITITLPRRSRALRRVTVRIGRGTARRVAVKRGRVTIDLRGRPRQTLVVRISSKGRRIDTRRYRTCR